MAQHQTNANHITLMGKLVVNLQSLEFALRAFLYGHETNWKKAQGSAFLEDIKQGSSVPENAFTNYDTLGKLIEKYNGIVPDKDAGLALDKDVTHIRDALAHGRIASNAPSLEVPSKLVKYDKPQNGNVRVTDCHMLTEKWFHQNINHVSENIEKIVKARALFDPPQ
jgi:hypothetical protein